MEYDDARIDMEIKLLKLDDIRFKQDRLADTSVNSYVIFIGCVKTCNLSNIMRFVEKLVRMDNFYR